MERITFPDRSIATVAAWYCLRSQPKHEHIAAAHLRGLVGVNVLCPRIRFKRMTRKGWVWVTEAIFPGYLFAHFEFFRMHRQVRYAHGVSGLLQFGGRVPTISDKALAHLQELSGLNQVSEVSYDLSQGDEIKVVDGALAGLEAVVTRLLPAKERVKILVDFLGRQIEAEVGHSSILRHTIHPLVS